MTQTNTAVSGLVLGAYALEPSADSFAAQENEWFDLLSGIDGAGGLEVPYRAGKLHPTGTARLANLLPSGWRIVVTMLPPTMAGLRASASYGLASPDENGRAAALADVRGALDEARRLADASGEQMVVGMHLTSAPRGHGSPQALTRSLADLADGAEQVRLFIEHCDSWQADRAPEKGFLTLDGEIEAVLAAREHGGDNVGIVVNWGRSAIDERDADAPAQHVRRLYEAGILGGVMFSGASATGGPLGAAWADVHNPLDTVDPTSLLTEARIGEALAGGVVEASHHVGVKVLDPSGATDLSARLEPLRVTAAAVLRRSVVTGA